MYTSIQVSNRDMCTIIFFFCFTPPLEIWYSKNMWTDSAIVVMAISLLLLLVSHIIPFSLWFQFREQSSIYIYILFRGLLVGNRVLELGARFPEESRRTFPHSFSLSGAAQTLKNRTDRKRRMEIGMEEEAAAAAALLLVSERKIVDRETRALGEGQEGGGGRCWNIGKTLDEKTRRRYFLEEEARRMKRLGSSSNTPVGLRVVRDGRVLLLQE